MSQKTILVTGGTGYIGSHTTIELQKKGYNVVIVDNLSNSTKDSLGRIEKITNVLPKFYEFDLQEKNKVDELFKENKIDAVIHFAANKAVGESVEKPLFYYKNNLLSLINVMEAMRDNGARNLVFSSSCAVYGDPENKQVDEKAEIQKAASPYGNTKKICEEIIHDSAKICDINTVALRYFNVVGAHDSGINGEVPIGTPANLFPYVTQTAIGIRNELKIFGGDYDTKDGTAVRDYIHVVDLANAHIKALERLLDDTGEAHVQIFNLGTGQGYTVKEVVDTFERVCGTKVPHAIIDRRPGDVGEIYADPTLANTVLGWKAQYGLEDMLKTAWEWEKNYRKK